MRIRKYIHIMCRSFSCHSFLMFTAQGRSSVLGGNGDMLLSVVLPVQQGGEEGGVLRSLDRLFVVLLQQSTVYATYSCKLPKLGFI